MKNNVVDGPSRLKINRFETCNDFHSEIRFFVLNRDYDQFNPSQSIINEFNGPSDIVKIHQNSARFN